LGKRKLLNERWLSIERKRKLLNEITESKQKETIVETPCERAELSERDRKGKGEETWQEAKCQPNINPHIV
jgi:hypothetical protein